MKSCFMPADILLPAKEIELTKWAVIACDQYTSQPQYWEGVEKVVGDKPSTYRMILPEIYLSEKENRMAKIHKYMQEYLSQGVLCEAVHQGFVLTERHTSGGIRLGIVGAIDLEQYDYAPDAAVPIRATEGTILSRIPPRVEIRRNSLVESPHIMMLAADKEERLIEPLFAKKEKLRKLYDFELMLGGGHLMGYAVDGDEVKNVVQIIRNMQSTCGSIFLAAGDGNHSLAAAKAYWTEIKKNLPDGEKESHPARYALAEVVNLYNPALEFEPIHRGVFGIGLDKFIMGFGHFLKQYRVELWDGGDDFIFIEKKQERELGLTGAGSSLPVDYLQRFLNYCVKERRADKVDYIHGEENVRLLAGENEDFLGILTGTIEKESLFPAISAGGVLPRKTFSIGEAEDKRYYLECRSLC